MDIPDSPSNPPRTSAPGDVTASVDAVALDLVRAATDEGDDAVVKTLLRSLVALELTDAASFWTAAPASSEETASWPAPEPLWTQRRGFGGSTPPPQLALPSAPQPSLDPDPFGQPSIPAPGAAWSLPFGPTGAVVVRRETFDGDGLRESREDQLASLVVLAETLLTGEMIDEAPSMLNRDDEEPDQRQAS